MRKGMTNWTLPAHSRRLIAPVLVPTRLVLPCRGLTDGAGPALAGELRTVAHDDVAQLVHRELRGAVREAPAVGLLPGVGELGVAVAGQCRGGPPRPGRPAPPPPPATR